MMKNSNNDSKKLIEKFNHNISWLNSKWIDYLELFDPNKIKLGLLNNSAPHFFYNLQYVLFDDIVLHICKLTDKKEFNTDTGSKNNLCLEYLIHSLGNDLDSNDIQLLKENLMKIKKKTQKIEKWRNRSIGHYELKTYLGESTLPNIPKHDFQSIIEDISAFMNIINQNMMDNYWKYDIQIESGHATSLLKNLEDGQKYKEMRLLLLANSIDDKPIEYIRRQLEKD